MLAIRATNAPGQGQSRKAKARRAKQTRVQNLPKTIIPQQVITQTVNTAQRTRRPRSRRTNIKKMNPYLATLKDPENISGIKVPAMCGAPTGTYQVTYETITAVDANGHYAICAFPQGALGGGAAGIGAVSVSTATDAAGVITWGNGFQPLGTQSSSTIYRQVRAVSACLKLEYIGNTSQDAGIIIGGWSPYHGDNTTVTANVPAGARPASTVLAMGTSYTQTYPLRNGSCITWRPQDEQAFEFQQNNLAISHDGNWATIWAVITGGTPGQNFKYRLTINYEGLPLGDSANFLNTAIQPSNHSWLEAAAEWAQGLGDKIYPLFNSTDPMIAKARQLAGAYAANYLNNRVIQPTRQRFIEL